MCVSTPKSTTWTNIKPSILGLVWDSWLTLDVLYMYQFQDLLGISLFSSFVRKYETAPGINCEIDC